MERSVQLFKAFSDPTRLRLLHLLAHRGPGICVCDLVEVLQVPQSTISRQMAPLKMLGLVETQRAGTWVLYSLSKLDDDFEACLRSCLDHCAGEGSELTADLARFDELMSKRELACCAGFGAYRQKETAAKSA